MAVHAKADDFLLRDLCETDAAAFLRHLNNLEVAGWLAQPPYPYLEEHAQEFLARPPAGWPSRAAIEVDGDLKGVISIDPHLGYWLAPDCWRRGIMYRSASLILDAHFAATDSQAVDSGVFEGNTASFGLLEKLGFAVVGRSETYCLPLRKSRPHIDMRLARDTWEARS